MTARGYAIAIVSSALLALAYFYQVWPIGGMIFFMCTLFFPLIAMNLADRGGVRVGLLIDLALFVIFVGEQARVFNEGYGYATLPSNPVVQVAADMAPAILSTLLGLGLLRLRPAFDARVLWRNTLLLVIPSAAIVVLFLWMNSDFWYRVYVATTWIAPGLVALLDRRRGWLLALPAVATVAVLVAGHVRGWFAHCLCRLPSLGTGDETAIALLATSVLPMLVSVAIGWILRNLLRPSNA